MVDQDRGIKLGQRGLSRRAFTRLTGVTLLGLMAACGQSQPATRIPFGAPEVGAKPTEPAVSTAKVLVTATSAASPEAAASPVASPAVPESKTATSNAELVAAQDLKDPNLQKLITNPKIINLKAALESRGIPMTLSYQYNPKAGILTPQTMRARVREEDTERKGINFREIPVLDPANVFYDVPGFSPGDWIEYAYHLTTGSIKIPNSTTIEWVATRRRNREGFTALREMRTGPQAGVILDTTYATPLDYGLRTAIVTGW